MKHKVCVIGNMCLTVISKVPALPVLDGNRDTDTSIEGSISARFGGVGRNIALSLSQFDMISTELITVLSRDFFGKAAQEELNSKSISWQKSAFIDIWSAFYIETITDVGHFGTTDMRAITQITPEKLEQCKSALLGSDYLVVDMNLPTDTLDYITREIPVPIFCDATSNALCPKMVSLLPKLTVVKVNYSEACMLCGLPVEEIPDIERLKDELLNFPINEVFVTLGSDGSFFLSKTDFYRHTNIKKRHYQNVLGCGDAYSSGIIKCKLDRMSVQDTLVFCSAQAERILLENNRDTQQEV
jgi:pseudouridine kinase